MIETAIEAVRRQESDEWLEWYAMTPAQRWEISQRLREYFIKMGGSFDPEPDSQSPFFFEKTPRAMPPDGRTGLRFIRRCGI